MTEEFCYIESEKVRKRHIERIKLFFTEKKYSTYIVKNIQIVENGWEA